MALHARVGSSQQLVSLHDFSLRPAACSCLQSHPLRAGHISALQQCASWQTAARRGQACQPLAATRGRPRKDADDENSTSFMLPTPGRGYIAPQGEIVFEERTGEEVMAEGIELMSGEPAEEEEDDFVPDPLENWVDNILDWNDFAEHDVLSGTNLSEADAEADALPWKTPLEKREYLEKHIMPRMEELKQRPDFTAPLPAPDYKVWADETCDPIMHEPQQLNPDWDEWEFRCHVEKEARKQRDREAWTDKRALVNNWYLEVHESRDLRLLPEREWTNEEIFGLITMGGTAALPANIEMKVEDPDGRVDILEVGGEYIESTEDFLRRHGHLLEQPPTQEDMEDLGVTQLAGEFADFKSNPDADATLASDSDRSQQAGLADTEQQGMETDASDGDKADLPAVEED